MNRKRMLLTCCVVITVLIALGTVLTVRRSDRLALQRFDEATGLLETREYARAHALFSELLTSRPKWDEARFQRGRCALALGRDLEALEDWASIASDSPMLAPARLEQSRVEERRGSLQATEGLLRIVLKTRGPLRVEARRDLVRILRVQGRHAEALDVFDQGRSEFKDLFTYLNDRYRLVAEPPAIEGLQRYYQVLNSRGGHDPLMRLGEANLALLTGRLPLAAGLLAEAERLAPGDRPVLAAKFRLALATDRLTSMPEIFEQLRPVDLTDTELVDLGLRLASKARTRLEERAVLEGLDQTLPNRSRIIGRLAVICEQLGDLSQAARSRETLAQIEARREVVKKALERKTPCIEFDPVQFLKAGSTSPEAELFGLAAIQTPAGSSVRSLADLFAMQLHRIDITPASGPALLSKRVLPRFRDLAESSGLLFQQRNGSGEGKARRLIPPITASGGVGLIDFDGDGLLDVYAVQGGTFPPSADSSKVGDRLFRNVGNGRFVDVTDRAGLGGYRGYGHGVVVGDFDNDGFPDLFVTRWRSYALYRNRGDGTFADVTISSGLGGDRDWPTSAAFADLDGDGDLDLFVCHYLKWDENDRRPCVDQDDPSHYNCSPKDFPALPDHLFRNDAGRFVDVSKQAGITDIEGRGFGVVVADLDSDGKIDLFVANDMSANALYRNKGGLRFEEVALESGVAANGSGGFQAGMGVACGDLDGDGLPDLAVTNFFNESTTFFQNLGHGHFGDQTSAIGLAAPSRFLLGFGICFFDANNDGRLDLLSANGHVVDGRPQFPWMMPLQLMLGTRSGRLIDASSTAGEAFDVLRLGRGLAVGDLDNDGRTDALVVSQNGPLAYLHNETESTHRSLTLLLEGRQSNRDAVGAVVTVRAGGRSIVRHRVGGGSYQSSSDPRIQVGLENASSVDSVEILWPSGLRQRLTGLNPGAGYRVIEGETKVLPLPTWSSPPRIRQGNVDEP